VRLIDGRIGGPLVHPFRIAVEARDIAAVVDLLAEDVVFRSPVAFNPYEGRSVVATLLEAALHVFQDFRYVRELGKPAGRDVALVFDARIAGRQVEGCDVVHTDDSGRITELAVMVRPLSGVLALNEGTTARLAAPELRG
jgi:hypothetical protein